MGMRISWDHDLLWFLFLDFTRDYALSSMWEGLDGQLSLFPYLELQENEEFGI